MPAPIVSPFPAIVKEIITTPTPTTRGLATVTVRGRVLEVSVIEDLTLIVGDPVLVELLPASRQWLIVPFIR